MELDWSERLFTTFYMDNLSEIFDILIRQYLSIRFLFSYEFATNYILNCSELICWQLNYHLYVPHSQNPCKLCLANCGKTTRLLRVYSYSLCDGFSYHYDSHHNTFPPRTHIRYINAKTIIYDILIDIYAWFILSLFTRSALFLCVCVFFYSLLFPFKSLFTIAFCIHDCFQIANDHIVFSPYTVLVKYRSQAIFVGFL